MQRDTIVYCRTGLFRVPERYVKSEETMAIELTQSDFRRILDARESFKALHYTRLHKISVRNIVVVRNMLSGVDRRTSWFVRFVIYADDRLSKPIGRNFLWQLPHGSVTSVQKSLTVLAGETENFFSHGDASAMSFLSQNIATPQEFDPKDYPEVERLTSLRTWLDAVMVLLVKPAPGPALGDDLLYVVPYRASATFEPPPRRRPSPVQRPISTGAKFSLTMSHEHSGDGLDYDVSHHIMQTAVTNAVRSNDVATLCALNATSRKLREMVHAATALKIETLYVAVRSALRERRVDELVATRDALFAQKTCALDLIREGGPFSFSSFVRCAKGARDRNDTPRLTTKRKRAVVLIPDEEDFLKEHNA